MLEKLKSFLLNDQLFYGILVLLVAVVSFLLGSQQSREDVVVQPQNKPIPEEVSENTLPSVLPKASTALSIEGEFVASRSGTRYHLLTCPGAKQIKEENKIYFSTEAEAAAAGYKRAANCP
jgi:hypothetical protein